MRKKRAVSTHLLRERQRQESSIGRRLRADMTVNKNSQGNRWQHGGARGKGKGEMSNERKAG